MKIGVGVKKPTNALGMASVVGASSWPNTKFKAVRVDEDAISRTRTGVLSKAKTYFHN